MAREITVTDVLDLGADDRIKVVGAIDGEPAEAFGWKSATTNYYPPSAYTVDEDGNLALVEGAASRQMTADEIRDYATTLLDSGNPPAPVSLL